MLRIQISAWVAASMFEAVMPIVLGGLIVAGLLPLALMLRANRHTSLAHAILWAIAAWLTWGVALVFGEPEKLGMAGERYIAICVTGCAGVAVLGARRPQVGAWNFVVAGLLLVMAWPLLEALVIGMQPLSGIRMFFVAATVAVGILNYLPTRLAPAAVLMLASSAGEIALLFVPNWFAGRGEPMGLHLLLLMTPWMGWLCQWRRGADASEFDRLWLRFRDRWGLFWSQRVREQFNQAVQHAGWPVTLTWRGLVIQRGAAPPTQQEQDEIIATLRAVLQRFIAPTND